MKLGASAAIWVALSTAVAATIEILSTTDAEATITLTDDMSTEAAACGGWLVGGVEL